MRAHDAGARIAGAVVDLVIPTVCGGCGAPGTRWCRRCALVFADTPIELRTSVMLPVPAYALGRYTAARRHAILELKEHGRTDLAVPIGLALATALLTLDRWSALPRSARLVLVPAPTRWWAARRRGGDPVTALAAAAAGELGPGVCVVPALVTSSWARDSAGLSAPERGENLSGAVRLRRGADLSACGGGAAVVLVDDVLTTGSTAAHSIEVLRRAGIEVHLVLVVAAA
ncbi:ComF family protein [Williamsia soli]|uniref:ComF family protein n=1 Tax=Williamsia soli TaxID=364929 RepID=UPI001A9D712D|nr:ComF family protein [Williamsia soli]